MAVDGCHAAGAPAGSVRAFVFQKRMHDPCKNAYWLSRAGSVLRRQLRVREGLEGRELSRILAADERLCTPCPGPDRGCSCSCWRVLYLLFRGQATAIAALVAAEAQNCSRGYADPEARCWVRQPPFARSVNVPVVAKLCS